MRDLLSKIAFRTALEAKGTEILSSVGEAYASIDTETLEVAPLHYGLRGANMVLAGPTNGANDYPTFRALVAADINTVAMDLTTAQTAAGIKTFAAVTTGNNAKGTRFTPTLTATAATQTLYGVEIAPTFSSGAFADNTMNYFPIRIVFPDVSGVGNDMLQIGRRSSYGGLTFDMTGSQNTLINYASNMRTINGWLRSTGASTSNYVEMLHNGTNSILQSAGAGQLTIQPSAGSVIIGGSTDAASALLNLISVTKGFLPPRMTKTQRDAISSPADGLMLYQTDNNVGLKLRVSGAWHSISTVADP